MYAKLLLLLFFAHTDTGNIAGNSVFQLFQARTRNQFFIFMFLIVEEYQDTTLKLVPLWK